MKRSIFFKTSTIFFLTGLAPLLLFYFLAVQSYQEIEEFIPLFEPVFPELAREMRGFYGNIGTQFALVFLLASVLIIFSSVIYGRYLISSIDKLIKGANRIARGKYDVKINIKTDDELEILGDTFNRMARELREKTETIQEAKTTLEIKVKARTRELEELTQSLDQKVRERTKALEERIKELERFHKLTIGRELKMVELKQEIERLKKELEKGKK